MTSDGLGEAMTFELMTPWKALVEILSDVDILHVDPIGDSLTLRVPKTASLTAAHFYKGDFYGTPPEVRGVRIEPDPTYDCWKLIIMPKKAVDQLLPQNIGIQSGLAKMRLDTLRNSLHLSRGHIRSVERELQRVESWLRTNAPNHSQKESSC